MSEVFDGLVEVQDGGAVTTVQIDGDSGSITAGGNGQTGTIDVADAAGGNTIHLDGNAGVIRAGGAGGDGSVSARDPNDVTRVLVTAPASGAGGVYIQNNDQDVGVNILDVGRISVRQHFSATDIRDLFEVDAGATATLTLGAEDRPGKATLRDDQGNDTIVLDADSRDFMVLGDNGETLLQFKGDTARLRIGNAGNEGDLTVRDGDGRNVLTFDGGQANLKIGAPGGGNEGDVRVFDDAGDVSIHLDGATGEVTSTGADCAEHFTVRDATRAEPGTVMVIDDAGQLCESRQAYDRRVAGVLSGAGAYRPGIVLDKRRDATNRKPVALVGKVYCKVDASYGGIAVGDLLTSAVTPGHAMKAADPARAFGAVIGKALAPLAEGRDLIPILVALQ